jgi:hypothetical protein
MPERNVSPPTGDNRPREAEKIRYNAGEKRAHGVPQIPPETVDTDGRGTPRGMSDVADNRLP